MKYQTILTQNEIQLLINACDKIFKKEENIKKFKLIINLFIATGMRDSELVNSKVNWIVEPKGKDPAMIRVQSNDKPVKFEPKYISEREIPIPYKIYEQLLEFIGKRKGGYIFKSQNKSDFYRYNKRSIINYINQLSKDVFNKTLGTHVFRRTFASYLYSKFKDVIHVQKLMGHKSPSITWRYIQSIPTRENYPEMIEMDIFKYDID